MKGNGQSQPAMPGGICKLIFDVHFRGFTPLNDVDQSIHLAEYATP
jgi:hypothetical protein